MYIYVSLISTTNVGKDASPMDPMRFSRHLKQQNVKKTTSKSTVPPAPFWMPQGRPCAKDSAVAYRSSMKTNHSDLSVH